MSSVRTCSMNEVNKVKITSLCRCSCNSPRRQMFYLRTRRGIRRGVYSQTALYHQKRCLHRDQTHTKSRTVTFIDTFLYVGSYDSGLYLEDRSIHRYNAVHTVVLSQDSSRCQYIDFHTLDTPCCSDTDELNIQKKTQSS